MLAALILLNQPIIFDSVFQGALRASEAPPSLRAAFTVELSSRTARRVFSFDPRRNSELRWQLLEASGNDPDLDEVAQSWANETAPDGWLFPDDLSASVIGTLEISDLGAAWRIGFHHAPSPNDTDLDVWAITHLRAEAWIDPISQRFLRLDYALPFPVSGPQGGRLLYFRQSYLLDYDPLWQLSYVSKYKLAFEVGAGFQRVRREYEAAISEATFFFVTTQAQSNYIAEQPSSTRPR